MHETLMSQALANSGTLHTAIASGATLVLQAPTAAMLGKYTASLAANPLKTKLMTSATLAVVGDGLAQSKATGVDYDLRRASSFVLFDCSYRVLQVRVKYNIAT